jgi:hypothetical protein
MSKRRVVYNGVEMVEGWPERIEEAQTILTYIPHVPERLSCNLFLRACTA